jgi:hypothetical protein
VVVTAPIWSCLGGISVVQVTQGQRRAITGIIIALSVSVFIITILVATRLARYCCGFPPRDPRWTAEVNSDDSSTVHDYSIWDHAETRENARLHAAVSGKLFPLFHSILERKKGSLTVYTHEDTNG